MRAKPPLRAVLKIGLTRESRGDRDSCCWVPGHVVFSLKDCIARVNEFYKEIYSSDTYSTVIVKNITFGIQLQPKFKRITILH